VEEVGPHRLPGRSCGFKPHLCINDAQASESNGRCFGGIVIAVVHSSIALAAVTVEANQLSRMALIH